MLIAINLKEIYIITIIATLSLWYHFVFDMARPFARLNIINATHLLAQQHKGTQVICNLPFTIGMTKGFQVMNFGRDTFERIIELACDCIEDHTAYKIDLFISLTIAQMWTAFKTTANKINHLNSWYTFVFRLRLIHLMFNGVYGCG